MELTGTLAAAVPREHRAMGYLKVGALAAFARALFNIAQFVYIAVYAQFISEAERYDPAVLRAHKPLLYVEPVIMIGMGLGLVLAVWVLFDLMQAQAPGAMRLSLVTAVICGGTLFLVAGQAIARFDGLFLFDAYPADQQGFALRTLDLLAVVLGHVMVASHAFSTLLWAYAGWRTGLLPKALSIAGLLTGALGILFEFTPANLLGFLLQVPLFLWLGISLWRKASTDASAVVAGSLAQR